MALIETLKRQGDFLFRYRSYFPLLFLIAGITVYAIPIYRGVYNYQPFYYFVCFAVSIIGFAIRVVTIGYTPKNTSGRNTKEQVADVVNTTGMYSLIRHPLYLGNFFMWLGLALLTRNIWFISLFTLLFWIYYERIMFAEEYFLRNKFGDAYTSWADRVPAFIPRYFKWVKPGTSFSFRKALRRETIGLFKLALLFFVFHYLYDFFHNGFHPFRLSSFGWLWFYSMLFFTFFYLLIRTLRKKTRLLLT